DGTGAEQRQVPMRRASAGLDALLIRNQRWKPRYATSAWVNAYGSARRRPSESRWRCAVAALRCCVVRPVTQHEGGDAQVRAKINCARLATVPSLPRPRQETPRRCACGLLVRLKYPLRNPGLQRLARKGHGLSPGRALAPNREP